MVARQPVCPFQCAHGGEFRTCVEPGERFECFVGALGALSGFSTNLVGSQPGWFSLGAEFLSIEEIYAIDFR